MNLLYCKRTRTFGTPALVYATGMPSSQLTFAVTSSFLWDAMMVSGILSLLDPVVMRHQLEDWLESDIHQGYGIDFLSGKPLGFWYAVNDYALIHMAYQYVRYTGDEEWLTKKIKGKPVFEHLVESADYWKHIADGDGLADYGEKENLLECVSTYTHKVASLTRRTSGTLAPWLGSLPALGNGKKGSACRASRETGSGCEHSLPGRERLLRLQTA